MPYVQGRGGIYFPLVLIRKTGFASHTKPTAEAIQRSTSFMRDNM